MSSRHRDTQPPPGPTRHTLIAILRGAGCVFAEDEADLLLAAASGSELARLLERRVAGEPLEHLLGRVRFAGLDLVVTPGVFVPRRRTELLASVAVRLAAALPSPVVVDLCCGVGAVAAVVAARVPAADMVAADVDPAAVACAERNLDPASVHLGDLYDALPGRLRGRVDVLAVNAPYVPTAQIATMPPEARDHEPRLALDGGDDGLDVHRRVAAAAVEWLAPGGALVVEVARRQVDLAVGLQRSVGLDTEVETDEETQGCVVVGVKSRP